MNYIRKLKSFVLAHEKKIMISFVGLFVIVGPMFGGSVAGEIIDKIIIGGTVLANGRILEIF